jgi:indolepyruvate ferredoxin oxidoreductase beta subunit
VSVKQQIIVSGLGGQGALTLTRLLAEVAAAKGLEVITSETHGMAQRGGTVISMVKVGPFRGPLIPAGAADVGLFLHQNNLTVHRFYLKAEGAIFVNSPLPGDYFGVDAFGLAEGLGLLPVTANLIVLGFAAGKNRLFCEADSLEQVISDITPIRFQESNLKAFRVGVEKAAA